MDGQGWTALPPSPTPSLPSTTTSTQIPTSKPLTPSLPQEEVQRLTNLFNRRLIPLMDDDTFHLKLQELSSSAADDLESDISAWVREESNRLASKSLAATIQMSIRVDEYIADDEQQDHFLQGIKNSYTLHGWQRLLAYTLPTLLASTPQTSPSLRCPCQRRTRRSKQSSNRDPASRLRRSARIEKRRMTQGKLQSNQ